MGLDQYVYKVSKLDLENRIFKVNELKKQGYSLCTIEDVEKEKHLYEEMLPYTIVRDVEGVYVDLEKIKKTFNMPENIRIYMNFDDVVGVMGTTETGETVKKEISRTDIEKDFQITKIHPTYIWNLKKLWDGNKRYDIQNFFYEKLENIDNTRFNILNAELIKSFNIKYGELLPAVDPSKTEALFYYEWY